MKKKELSFSYFKDISDAIKQFFKKNRKTLLYISATLPLVISLIAYFAINKKEGFQSESYDYFNRDLIEGINHYRLENYERAEILIKRAAEGANRRKIDSIAFLYLGNIEYQRGNYRGALEYFEESLSYDKKNIYAMYNIATSYMKTGNPNLTRKYALKIFELQEEYRPNLLLLGNIYYAAGKYKKALSIYEIHETKDGVFMMNAASAYLNLGSHEKAVNLLNKVIEDPLSGETLKGISSFKLSNILEKSDGFKAVGYLSSALEKFPSSPVLRYNLSLLLFRHEEYEESVNLLKSVEGTLKEGNVDTLLGMALFKSENLNEALDHYLDIYAKTGDTSIAHIIGDIYIKLGEFKKAEEYYIKALQIEALQIEDLKGLQYEAAFRNLVNIYIIDERYKEAADLCEDLKRRDHDNPLPYICLADVYFNTDRNAEGRRSVEEALLLAEKTGQDINLLSMAAALYQENDLHNNAIQIYHRILSLDPGYYQPYVEIAEIYMQTGHTDKAREFLVNGKEMVDDPVTYYQLSLFQAEVENEQKAFDIYNELIRDFPYRYEAYFNLSLKYIENRKYENAVQTVKKCLDSDIKMNYPVRSELYTILGVAQQHIGNSGEAAKAFKESLRLDKKNEYSFVNLRGIDQ
jgi:tetratricopeptide (TPR) repeat protein